MRALVFSVLIILVAGPAEVAAADIATYASVQDDGTLRMRGRTIRLFGIYIPSTGDTCRPFQVPARCAPRAAKALEFKKGARFVHCKEKWKNQDGSITAVCQVDGEDLSAYLVSLGWALALPDAPFEYAALEKIARRQRLGVWGFQVDAIRKSK